jgi:hypothetical protein
MGKLITSKLVMKLPDSKEFMFTTACHSNIRFNAFEQRRSYTGAPEDSNFLRSVLHRWLLPA